MWDVFYAIAFAYPNQPTPREQDAARQYFGSVEHLLPCEYCRDHYAAFLRNHPVRAESSAALSAWVLQLNNDVNARTRKPPVTLAEVWDRLVENGHVQRRQCIAAFVCLVLLGALLLYLVLRR